MTDKEIFFVLILMGFAIWFSAVPKPVRFTVGLAIMSFGVWKYLASSP